MNTAEQGNFPLDLLGLSAEDLSLEPSDSRQGFLELVSQLGDLSLLTAYDLLIHRYFGVKLETVWEVIERDIPDLRAAIDEMLEQ
ncbi:MAG: DUF86 domain-containing protein [Phycisphaerae bacterium]|nr:DUF86 domain-containing protein [Phycisphaerae bacterium]